MHRALLISQPQAAVISVVSSPWLSMVARLTAIRTGPRRTARRLGPLKSGVSISNPREPVAGEVDTGGFQSSIQTQSQRHRQRVCLAAETSGPAFIKPRWVCSKDGSAQAHRLRATKEGRENVREGGRARRETEKEKLGPHKSRVASQPLNSL